MASTEQPTPASTGIRLPSQDDIAEMFRTLLGIGAEARPLASSSSTAAYSLSLHANADGELIGAVGSDLAFTANTAIALAGQNPKLADDVVHKGTVGLDLWDNFREVSNVMNVLFTGGRYPRVLLHSVQRVDLPVWSRLQHSEIPSVSYSLEIEGYAPASVSIFSLADLHDEELLEVLRTTGAEAAAHDTQVVDGKLIKLYDFHKPKGVERTHLNALRSNLNSFTKGAAAAMTELLQNPTHIKLIQLHHQGWDDYAGTLDNNAFITTFRLDPLPSQFVLTLSPGLSMKCLDCRLSGSHAPGSIRHTLTDLDVALLTPIVRAVIEELAASLSQFVPVRAQIVRHVTEKFMMEGVTLSLTWLVAWMTVSVAGNTFDASLCFPVVPMQPVLQAMADVAQHGEHRPGEAEWPLDDVVPDLEVELSAHFPTVRLPIDELSQLAPGAVVSLDVDQNAHLVLTARGRPLATIEPLVVGRRLGVQILEFITDPEEFLGI